MSLHLFENYSPNTALNAAVRDFEMSHRRYNFMLFSVSTYYVRKRKTYCLLQQMLFQDSFFLIKSIEIV